MSDKKSRGAGRTRSWTFILYPESAPENWRDILDEFHVEWIESPLHDKDKEANGDIKKPHWHILIIFESVKAYEQVKEITDSLNAPHPQKCAGAKALVDIWLTLTTLTKHNIILQKSLDMVELMLPTSSDPQLLTDMLILTRCLIT